ncbi:MAG TPA: hypothetical protein VKU44_06740 [Terriglobia bacterium]|nr:hypothetical protein [Terriglobia bacterium]
MMMKNRELQLAAAGIVLVVVLVLMARHGSSQPSGNNGPIAEPAAATAAAPDASNPASPASDSGATATVPDTTGATGATGPASTSSPGLLSRLIHSEKPITLPEGTRIDVRLIDTIGTARNRSGDTFQATLDAPLVADGTVIAPRGATVTGRVISARASGHLETPPEFAVTLTSVEASGKNYEIRTSTDSWRGHSHKGHDAKWIGGLAGAGALVGALAGHGAGAAIGAGTGAGAGTAGAYATGKHDITLASETRLRFVLRQPVTVTKAG